MCRLAPRVPPLQQFGRDLTEQAKRGELDPVIGREAIITRVSHILLRRTKNNPLLLGDPGVGKTAIAEGMARLMMHSQVLYTAIGLSHLRACGYKSAVEATMQQHVQHSAVFMSGVLILCAVECVC